MLDLAERMTNNYEKRSKQYLIRRMPVIIRLDGRAFHSYCKGLDKPFDKIFMENMDHSALKVTEEMQGFKLAYIQSDEASFLLTDYDKLETDAWFDYNKSKIETISASLMTMYFNTFIQYHQKLAHFDARAFNIPENEVANYFIWRSRDWERNSIQMYTRSFYSQKQLQNMNREGMHDMLYEKGKNWSTDLTDRERNGMYILKQNRGIVFYQVKERLDYDTINKLIKEKEE